MARLLGFLLRINHSLDKTPEIIAICKFVGLGSIIQATPLIQTLRKNYPQSRILFITTESNKALFQHIKNVDEVLTVSDKQFGKLITSTLKLLFNLWQQKPDVYIDLEIYSNYSSIIATMSASRNRMGFFKNDKTYRKGMYTHMLFFNIKAPISQAYLQFARLIGCRYIIDTLSVENTITPPEGYQIMKTRLGTTPENYIVINPNASDLRLERRWPHVFFITLIESLINEFSSHKIILIGSKEEVDYVNSIASKINSPACINSAGKLTITELIMLIDNASLMITNDTGPMHIAFALKTKTVALFGPCSPQQYGVSENIVTHYKNVYCSPCVHEFMIPPCKGDNQCMKKITVEEVKSSVRKQLTNDTLNTKDIILIDYVNGTFPLGVVLRQ